MSILTTNIQTPFDSRFKFAQGQRMDILLLHRSLSRSKQSVFGGFHTIALGSEAEKSYIRLYQRSYGITMVAYGCSFYFAGSEGMCGSWDDGGVNFADGTPMDLSGDYVDKKARATALAQSWMIDPSKSHLWDPSTICDPSANCGTTEVGEVIPCNAVRTRRLQVNPGCTLTCADINIEQYREQCELDVLITGDPSWACAGETHIEILSLFHFTSSCSLPITS